MKYLTFKNSAIIFNRQFDRGAKIKKSKVVISSVYGKFHSYGHPFKYFLMDFGQDRPA